MKLVVNRQGGPILARQRHSEDTSLFDSPQGAGTGGGGGNGQRTEVRPADDIPVSVALHDAAQAKYLNYALSVITARALPDVRDGLKPVQRRIL